MKASSTGPAPNTAAVAASRPNPSTRDSTVNPATTGTPANADLGGRGGAGGGPGFTPGSSPLAAAVATATRPGRA